LKAEKQPTQFIYLNSEKADPIHIFESWKSWPISYIWNLKKATQFIYLKSEKADPFHIFEIWKRRLISFIWKLEKPTQSYIWKLKKLLHFLTHKWLVLNTTILTPSYSWTDFKLYLIYQCYRKWLKLVSFFSFQIYEMGQLFQLSNIWLGQNISQIWRTSVT
jgi:hypothetical protein